MIISNQQAILIDRIQKAGFDSQEMNRLAAEGAVNLTMILAEAELLVANADQAPHDAWRAVMLVEFIEETLPELIDPSETEEERTDRLTDVAHRDRSSFDQNFSTDVA